MNRPIQIGVGGIYHETNSFAPGKTTLEDFKRTWIDHKETYMNRYSGTRTSMGGTIDAVKDVEIELVPCLYTETTPSGMVTADAMEELLNSLLNSIPTSLDGLMLILHGAMVSETYPDVEAEIIKRLRNKLGQALPIAITLDLHANTSEFLVQQTTCIVGYDTYPHIDAYERAMEAMDILIRTIKGEINPTSAWRQSRMLVAPQTMLTEKGAMKELMDLSFELEKNPKILNVTVAGGFPYSDVPDAGMSFVVTTDGDKELAEKSAKQLSEKSWSLRDQFVFKEVSVEEAIDWTLQQKEGPVIWAEGSDNVGGGAPADSTHILKHLLNFGEKSLIVIRDVEASMKAHQLGVGEVLDCNLGGKSDQIHGNPVKINGRIRLLFDGEFTYAGPYMGGKLENMGKTAVVEVNRTTIVITENRIPPFDINHVKSVGINPEDFKVIVAKSAVAWKTSFGDVAKNEIYIDTPGCCSANLHHFTYKQIKRPIYPIDK